jgi:hypothetical protein
MAQIDDLRRATNEPEGDSEYNDDDLESILQSAGSLAGAAAVVWKQKAAKAAELVDLVEGSSSRKLSDLADNALRMAALYQREADSGQASGSRRTTIGRISRA